MRIYEMKATFGKLEHQVLTLKPGLNIIQAPNEWGKSTWCAFLIAMLYGMDTRAKTTKTTLAEKEKYAPWSGSPMEGRIDLNWNGRDITIERRTKGRTPFGIFSAYETATGLEVPELTAANCGQMLLGVERSVFIRAGFLRLTDLPVTQDEALRRRLNALVTTGDESGAGDVLEGKLRDLKNRCRYNRSGLIPQAEAELAELEGKQRELDGLRRQMEDCRQRQAQMEEYLAQLKNHQTALQFAVAQADAGRVQAAETMRNEAALRLEKLEDTCRALPTRETAEQNLRSAQELQRQWMSMQMESRMLPDAPIQPEVPEVFRGIPVEQVVQKAKADGKEYARLVQLVQKKSWMPWLLVAVALAGGGALSLYRVWLGAAVAAVLLIAAAGLWMADRRGRQAYQKNAEKIASCYGNGDTAQWIRLAENYVNQRDNYQKDLNRYHTDRGDLDQRYEQIRLQMQDLTQGQDLQIYTTQWQQVLSAWDAWENARRDHQQAENHLSGIQAMAKSAAAPRFPDAMTYSEEQTVRLISDYSAQQRQLQLQMGKCQGAMAAIGDEQILQNRITALRQRISRLEETYDALTHALRTLEAAAAELQRRFAPRIAARAQELFGKLTDGRYDRLSLTQELAVNAGAEGEPTLRSAQWRSEGTVDQLYLALRLAVAEELTPNAPLVLDDALVRFDDHRLKKAMEILSGCAKARQVILFTCQGREAAAQSDF